MKTNLERGAHAPSRVSDRAARSEQRAPTRVESGAVALPAVDEASTAAREARALPKSSLPDGWRWAKLSEVCEVVMGQSPEGASYNAEGKGEPLLNGPTEFGDVFPTAVQWTTSPTRFCQAGDILLCVRGATTGRRNLADRRYCIGRGLAAIRGKRNQAQTDFLAFALELATEQILKEASGSTFPNIPGEKLEQVEIPLPPLSEQKRIAGILKEQMAAVERARRSAEAQLQAAESLPAAYLRAVFNSPEAQAWPRKKLGDIFKVKSGESMTAKAMAQGGQYPVYGGNGINGYHDAYLFEDRRLVIGRVGANCGCIHVSQPKSWVSDNALYVSQKLMEFDDDFMADALRFLDLNSKSNSMAQPLVTGQLIYLLEIGFPPLADQRRLALQLSGQMASAERLRRTLAEQLDALHKLPAALLRRAFNGEL